MAGPRRQGHPAHHLPGPGDRGRRRRRVAGSRKPLMRSWRLRPPRAPGGTMSYETIRYERDGHVAVLTYDRPGQRNAVSRQMNAELHDAWERFRDSEDAFVLVITGEGDAFCAGWDLADAAATTVDDWDEFRTHVYN